MPILEKSSYKPPLGFSNPHIQTVFPVAFRRVPSISYRRERLDLPDGDFLDLDWVCPGNKRLAVVLHGLEGSADRPYVRGMAHALLADGWDVLAWNFRGCSGEPNRRLATYHSGEIEDLDFVLRHVNRLVRYDNVALVGFSLGGNMVLRYLGMKADNLGAPISAGVGISVPCDLASSSAAMESRANWFYMWRFLRLLREKLEVKQDHFPSGMNLHGYKSIRTFREFDGRYTAPMFGFHDALDYWTKSSCLPILPKIRVPTFLLNAADDPFLAPPCFPVEIARQSQSLYLEVPEKGGHVGFIQFGRGGRYYSEERTVAFLREHGARASTGS